MPRDSFKEQFFRGAEKTLAPTAQATFIENLRRILSAPERGQEMELRTEQIAKEKQDIALGLRAATLTPEEQSYLIQQGGMESGTSLQNVRPAVALAGMPTQVYNPATQTWETKGPKTKAIPQAYLPPRGEAEIVEIEGTKFLKRPGRGGTDVYTVIPFQKGELGAVKETSDAITTYENIDGFFDAYAKISSEPARRFAASGLPGSAMLYPDAAQAESGLMTIYQFSRGGKQLTEPERKAIRELVKSAAYGERQREAAKVNFKNMVGRGIEAAFQSRALGDAEKYLRGEWDAIRGKSPKGAQQPVAPTSAQPALNPEILAIDAELKRRARGEKK